MSRRGAALSRMGGLVSGDTCAPVGEGRVSLLGLVYMGIVRLDK